MRTPDAEHLPELDPMPGDWQRALAVAAHPDDMEYGAAAAVSHWTDEGKDVAYLLVTRGEAGIDGLEPAECARVREAEQRAGARAVGVGDVRFLGHRDGVVEEGVPLRRDLAGVLRAYRPDLVLTLNHTAGWGGNTWNTPDHRAVGRSVLDAVGDAGNRWIFPEQLTGGVRHWKGVRWTAVFGSPEPTHAVPVGERARERAAASLAAHRAYLTGLDGGGEQSPEAVAREITEGGCSRYADRFGGRACVAFQLFTH